MRMLVLGAGGTGGYFGGRAAQAGVDVTFLVREARAETLRRDGLRIKSPVGDATLAPKLAVAGAAGGPYDVVVLSCKAYDLDSAIEAIRPAVGEGTAVLPIMNGVGQYDVLDAAFGAHRVLGGLCQIVATMGPAGEVVHMGQHANLVYGERAGEPRSERCLAIEQALAGVNFTARLSEDIYQDIWEKYVFLTALAASTCLMRGAVGQIVSAGGEDFMRALLRETQSVAAANGHRVRAEADAAALKSLTDASSTVTASMFRDLSQGGRIEGDHLVGEMVRRAAAAGLAVPYLALANIHLQVYQARRAASK